MAYNPFNIFRRNQKAIFAVVTVFVMFTFVLSSGIGGKADFFEWLPDFVGRKAKKGEQICTIDGTKVYERDVSKLQRQRVLASKFMVYAAGETINSLQRQLIEQMGQGTPEFRNFMQYALRDPRMMQFAAQMIASNPKSTQADKDGLRTLELITALSQSAQMPRVLGTYFANVPNRNDRDRVEFLLWERKAQALGIDFRREDVGKLLDQELMGHYRGDVEVRKQLSQEIGGFNFDDCLTALVAEFRVRAAQNVLLGESNPVGRAAPAPGRTPNVFDPAFDLYEFYRDKTSPSVYQVLAVPAANFTGEVKEPADDVLQRLFNERKGYEPDPAKEEPGFHEPRKVKVEWVSATGDEKYYLDAAKVWVTRTEQLAKSEIWGLIVPVPGIGPAGWAAMAAAPAVVKEPLVSRQYQTEVANIHKLNVAHRWDGTSSIVVPLDILDTSVVRPQSLAAAAGGAAGAAAGFGPAFLLPANLMYSAAVSGEQRARVKAGLPAVLGVVPGPGLLATTVGGLAEFEAAVPAPLPLDAVKPELLKKMTEQKARELAIADLKKLKEDVDKLTEDGRAKDKSAAREAIADFVKTRGLKTGGSTAPQSEWTIGDDPGLAPLKTLKDRGIDGRDPHADLSGAAPPVLFGQKFFWTTSGRGREQATGTYRPEFYPEKIPDATPTLFGKPEPVFLAWRTEEVLPKSLPFQVAKPRVIEAWKLKQARELAKAKAEQLAAELRAKPSTSEFFITQDMADMQARLEKEAADPAAKSRVKLFPIDNVAPFPISGGAGGVGTKAVQPFQLQPSANLPYPTPEMAKALLDDRTKPVKTVLVLPDQPKSTYYVIALVSRKEQDPSSFKATFAGIADRQVAGQLRSSYFGDEMMKARESVLGLLKTDLRYVETDDQKKRLDDREKRSGSDE